MQEDDKILRFVNSKDAPRLSELGTSCPDHFLRTKIKPLYVELESADRRRGRRSEEESSRAGIEQYRKDYAAYYQRCKHANSPAMRRPQPDRHSRAWSWPDRLGQGQE